MTGSSRSAQARWSLQVARKEALGLGRSCIGTTAADLAVIQVFGPSAAAGGPS